MKWVALLLLFIQGICAAGFAAGLPLRELGDPLQFAGYDIVWEAPTNSLPARLWVYRALTTKFSPVVVSNLMALGSFSLKDKVGALGPAPFNDPRALCYYIPAQARSLGIYPTGLIDYRDNRIRNSLGGKGVPSEDGAYGLATNYLRMLGVDLSGFAKKPGGSGPRVWFRATKDMVMTNGVPYHTVSARGVSFARQIDGVEFSGHGLSDGFSIDFGANAKVGALRLLWRKLKPEKSYPTLTAKAMMQRLRTGCCVWAPYGLAQPEWIKKIIIKEATPYYFGKYPTETQNYIYPFADLTTTLEMVRTNYVLSTEHPAPNTLVYHTNIISATLIKTNITMHVCCPIIE
jgi:hypothetical protein